MNTTIERLHIITPVGRPDHLPRLAQSLSASGLADRFAVVWWLMFNGPIDHTPVPGAHVVHRIESPAHGFDADGRPAFGHAQRAHALDLIGDTDTGWCWVLDDDNLVHPDFARGLDALIRLHPHARAFVVAQRRADGYTFPVCPENIRPCGIDTAQYILRRDLIGAERIRPGYAGDGGFVQRVYQREPSAFVLAPNAVLAYHNGMEMHP